MISLKRYGSAVATAAAFAVVAIAPAATAATAEAQSPVAHQARTGPVNGTCATLTAQLNTQLSAATAALAAVQPNVVAAQTAVSAAQATLVQLQVARCLPETPPVPPTCAAVAAQLATNLQALNAALANPNPNPLVIDAAVNAVINTAAQLRVCLS
jgi:hypothetical protein